MSKNGISKRKSINQYIHGTSDVKLIKMEVYCLSHLLCQLSNFYRYKGGIFNKHWTQTPANTLSSVYDRQSPVDLEIGRPKFIYPFLKVLKFIRTIITSGDDMCFVSFYVQLATAMASWRGPPLCTDDTASRCGAVVADTLNKRLPTANRVVLSAWLLGEGLSIPHCKGIRAFRNVTQVLGIRRVVGKDLRNGVAWILVARDTDMKPAILNVGLNE